MSDSHGMDYVTRALIPGATLHFAAPAQAVAHPIVTVASGALAGQASDDGLRIFRGIPYASPSLGALRLRAPQPVSPWAGVRNALRFGPQCPQNAPPHQQADAVTTAAQSEDCLTLNVCAPAAPNRQMRPAMVWVHGGAFRFGAGSLPVYDGAALARRDFGDDQ